MSSTVTTMKKARITTVLSLTGVLVAGSAAALVNTQVLQGTSTHKSTASEISVADQSSSSAATSVTNKFAQVAPVVLAPVVSSQSAFQIGTAGSVVLDTAGGVLTIVSVTPASGWTVVGSENSDDMDAEIILQSDTTRIEFKATLSDGQIVTSVESTDLTPTTSNSTVGSGSTSHDGDANEQEKEPPEQHDGGSSNSGKGGGGGGDD